MSDASARVTPFGRHRSEPVSEFGSRVVGLKSGARAGEVAFKSLPGAKRPPEKFKDNVIIVKTPAKKKSGGDDFINTPDNPYSVP